MRSAFRGNSGSLQLSQEAESFDDTVEWVTKLALSEEGYDFENCPTRVDRNGPYHTADVIAALVKGSCNLGFAAALLGRNRSRLREYVHANPDMLRFLHDTKDGIIDLIEEKVLGSAMLGDGPNGRFVLSTLGKDRGYTTRVESTGKDGAPIENSFSNAEELVKAIEAMARRMQDVA